MLYVVVGNDFLSRKKYLDSVYTTMLSKRPEAQLVVCDKDQFSKDIIDQHLSSVGLFDNKSIIKLFGVCEEKEHKDYLFQNIKEMIDSENAFLISEEKLGVADINKLKKHDVSIKECILPEVKKNDSLFVLGDLLLQKNKQALLLKMYWYLQQGTSIEEITGIVVWQIKSLCLALSNTQELSGLKPFVYNKCKKSSWTKQESELLYKHIIIQYHESRRGGISLQERIELLFLEL